MNGYYGSSTTLGIGHSLVITAGKSWPLVAYLPTSRKTREVMINWIFWLLGFCFLRFPLSKLFLQQQKTKLYYITYFLEKTQKKQAQSMETVSTNGVVPMGWLNPRGFCLRYARLLRDKFLQTFWCQGSSCI